MGRLILLITFLQFLTLAGFSQQEDDYSRNMPHKDKKVDMLSRFHLGGGADARFGPVTYIQLSPQLSFDVTQRLSSGIGLTYVYYRYNYDQIYGSGGIHISSIYGGSFHLNYRILESIVLYTEYESLNFEYYDPNIFDFKRKWVNSFFVGGGYRQYFNNGHSYVQMLLLYNLNYQPNSPYPSPWMPRISVYF